MCQICQSDEETISDCFVDIFERVYSLEEEAQIYRELNIGTDPQP